MTKTVAIVISPRAQIRGAFLNIPRILQLLGFRCLVLAGPQERERARALDSVMFHEILLFDLINEKIPSLRGPIGYLIDQTLVMLSLVRLLNKADLFLFSHVAMPLSAIMLKLFKKKSLALVGGASRIPTPDRFGYLNMKLESILGDDPFFRLVDTILVVSKGFTKSLPLAKYEKKIFETPIISFDANFFRRFHFSLPSNRKNIVGFVGRFSWEKGIMEFVTSLPLIASNRDDVGFMIIGDGELKDTLIEKLNSIRMTKSVRLLPWATNVEEYLQHIKLLIIPSKTEGLPSIMLEAMASGTLVLATPVGAIPDVIKEGNTGFLLKSNDPEYIADRVTVLLNRPELLEKVSTNAYRYVKESFSHKRTIECWRKPLIYLQG